VENCALASFKLLRSFDLFYHNHPNAIYDGVYEKESKIYDMCCSKMYLISVIFVFMGYAGVQLQQKTVWKVIVLINIVLGMRTVFDMNFGFGVDYVPYIIQAAAVYGGERDYLKISSS
jgi:hypothetical protein